MTEFLYFRLMLCLKCLLNAISSGTSLALNIISQSQSKPERSPSNAIEPPTF